MHRARLLHALVALTLMGGAPRAALAQEGPEGAASDAAIQFWRPLGDRVLEGLIARALESSPDVRAAAARVAAARAERLSAALDLAPHVTAAGGYSRQQLASAALGAPRAGTLPDQELWDAGLRLSWDVDVFGRTRSSLRARGALLDAAEVGVEDAHVLLAAEVAAAYFDLRGGQERLRVARRNAENQRSTLQITIDRLEGGRGTALDTERARAQLSSTLAVIPSLETAVAAAKNRIDALVGLPAGTAAAGLESDVAPPTLPEWIEPSDVDAVVHIRPDVRRAEHQVAASRALVAAARADYLPRISVTGTAGYTANAVDALGRSGTPRYSIGPVISWPLFDLGRVRAGVSAARARASEARAEYDRAVLDARRELETALIAYRGAKERLRHLEEAAAASERASDLARLRFREGASDFLQVLDAERTQLEAQDRLAAGRAEATAALVAIYRALGGQGAAPRSR